MTADGKVEIVPLDLDRIEEVARLFHSVWHETQAELQDSRIARYRDLAFFLGRVKGRAARTCIGLVQGRCVGFASWTAGTLNSLFVDRAFRGLGIGNVLCAEAEFQMARNEFDNFWLTCLVGNQAARDFYEARGWRVESKVVMKTETPEGLCTVGAWKMMKQSP